MIVASIGNTLGAVVNWALGRGIERFKIVAGFPHPPRRWTAHRPGTVDGGAGACCLWAPLGGDALTVTAGVLREPLWSFLLLVAVAKSCRYVVLAAVTAGLTA